MHRILARQTLSPNVTRLDVSAPRIAEIRAPGQFVIVHLAENSERIPLTIADSNPGSGSITLVIQAVGKSTQELVALKPGDSINDIAGPLGIPRTIQIPGPDGRTERSIGVAQDITDQTRKEEELRQLSACLLQLQDEERRRIARDLHDSVSQKLLTISLNLVQLGKSADLRSKRGKQVLTDTRKMVKDLSKEIRSLSYLLHPPLLDELGLASAVEEYVEGFSRRSGIDLKFEMPVDVGRLSPDSETALFRIVQEALGNIQKHSGSDTGRIRLTKDDGEVVLEIADRGRGMRVKDLQEREVAPSTLGVGILGMRERMRQLGGRLDISSGSRGTTVRATLPSV